MLDEENDSPLVLQIPELLLKDFYVYLVQYCSVLVVGLLLAFEVSSSSSSPGLRSEISAVPYLESKSICKDLLRLTESQQSLSLRGCSPGLPSGYP